MSFNRYWKTGEAKGDDESKSGTGFPDRWQLGSKHSSAQQGIDVSAASEEILSALRVKRGPETASWLTSLNQEIGEVSRAASPAASGANQQKQVAMVNWLDQMFDLFQAYADEFNQTAQGTDLIVNCSRPSYVYQLSNDHSPSGESGLVKVTTFEGHLSTRFWAMLIRGRYEKIEVFILPAETLLGFSARRLGESDYPPLIEISAIWQGNQLSWRLCDHALSDESLAHLTKELFGDLIRVASGTMTNAELFAQHSCKLALGESLAVGYVASDHTISSKGEAPSTALNTGPFDANPPATVSNPQVRRPDLTIIESANQLIAAIESNVSQLLQEGKHALETEDTRRFDELKNLTTKLDALKASLQRSLLELKAISKD